MNDIESKVQNPDENTIGNGEVQGPITNNDKTAIESTSEVTEIKKVNT